MGCLCVSKHKSWLYSFLMLTMMHSLMVIWQTQGVCIDEERKALLKIKDSLIVSYVPNVDHHLPTWVDEGGRSVGECCDWERVTCNTTTGHVTHLSLSNMMGSEDNLVGSIVKSCKRIWPLNVSLFLHFKELKTLNLSLDCLDDGIVSTGLVGLSSLKKLETLDLSSNFITNEIFPSLGGLTSLKVLYLGDNYLNGYFPALTLENLEILDLENPFGGGYLRMEGFEWVSLFKKLKVLNVRNHRFSESLVTSLGFLPSLKALNLRGNNLQGSFPAQGLSNITNIETLDLSENWLYETPSIQDCKSLSRLKKLESIALGYTHFDQSIISCISVLQSLKSLDLSSCHSFGSSFPIQELSHLPNLEVLLLSDNGFNGTLPMEALASFHHLEVLDLSSNGFFGSIPSTIQTLSSLRAVSFASNKLNGSLPDPGLCKLTNLHELDLSSNMFHGNMPQCFNLLSSLKLLDISSNQFTGTLPPSLIANMTSLEYIDLSHNRFEGSFSFSSFSNLTKLEEVQFMCNTNELEIDTEEPIGWIPLFQLKVLLLSGCNINRRKGSVVPGFLLHQYKLLELHLPDNSLEGRFPNWLFENNTMLHALNLRNNLFNGTIRMPLHRNANAKWLDVSENHLVGSIPDDIQRFLPYMAYLNLSKNSLSGVIPSSVGDLAGLWAVDLSENELSGEVPKGLLTNHSYLYILKLSENRLHGMVLAGNLSITVQRLALDNNCFTGKIGDRTKNRLNVLDISNNFFTGAMPHWISNISYGFELLVRNNSLEGRFPCGKTLFTFLDISQNSFSGPIPSCLNFKFTKHLHLGSNRFTGSIPNVFRNLTNALTLDISNNNLTGRIPSYFGELSNLSILVLTNNKFSGYIPKQFCQLRNMSLIDLSRNSLFGSIPHCLYNIISPIIIKKEYMLGGWGASFYDYQDVLRKEPYSSSASIVSRTQYQVQFTTKALSLAYKGSILDLMVGLDLSDNKLTGEIPNELGLLTAIHSLNLSHNQLSGPIPVNFSNLANMESLDLSSNNLSGEVPSQLIKLTYMAVFNVSYNNLSGRLLDMKAQFSTFTKECYEGNPLLCGPPLEKKCTATSQVMDPTREGNDKWHDIDMAAFYGTWVVFMLGFVAVLYINPYWRRRWLEFVEECMYTCYYFLEDSVRKLSRLFRR